MLLKISNSGKILRQKNLNKFTKVISYDNILCVHYMLWENISWWHSEFVYSCVSSLDNFSYHLQEKYKHKLKKKLLLGPLNSRVEEFIWVQDDRALS